MSDKKIKPKKIKRKLLDKYRLMILNENTFEERLSFKLTRLNVFVMGSIIAIFFIVLTYLLIAFTPLREYIPGYSSTALKKKATVLSYRTDSLQRVIHLNDRYYESIKKVLTGDLEAINFNRDSIIQAVKLEASEVDLAPIAEDSLLREKVDKEDKYNLFESATSASNFVLFPPVSGTISEPYNAKEKHYAVDVVVAKDTPVKATADGIVVFAEWNMLSLKSALAKPFAKRIYNKVQKWANNPIETQHKVFQELISEATSTQFGQDHDFVEAARNAILFYIHETGNAKFVNGKMIFLQGSPILNEQNGVQLGRLSGIVAHYVPKYLQKNRLPSWDTNCIEDWETKVDAIVEETLPENMTIISGIPSWKGMLLQLNSGIFYEFIRADAFFEAHPKRITIGAVEVGVNYVMIISTNAGLWSYNLGDTVEFTSTAPYRVIVSGRIKHFISAFGEHVIGKEVELAMQEAQKTFPI